MLAPVLVQLLHLLPPADLVGIPNEADLLQDLHPCRRHRRRLPRLHQLVLPPLALDPPGQLGVGIVRVRDEGVAVRGAEVDELLELLVPLLLVEGLEAGAVGGSGWGRRPLLLG